MANPTASAYGFGLDKSKPGQFVVSFRSSQKHEVQSWVGPSPLASLTPFVSKPFLVFAAG